MGPTPFPVGNGFGPAQAPFLKPTYALYLRHLIRLKRSLNGVADVDAGAFRPHFLNIETRLRHVAPRFENMTWGRRCRVCSQCRPDSHPALRRDHMWPMQCVPVLRHSAVVDVLIRGDAEHLGGGISGGAGSSSDGHYLLQRHFDARGIYSCSPGTVPCVACWCRRGGRHGVGSQPRQFRCCDGGNRRRRGRFFKSRCFSSFSRVWCTAARRRHCALSLTGNSFFRTSPPHCQTMEPKPLGGDVVRPGLRAARSPHLQYPPH